MKQPNRKEKKKKRNEWPFKQPIVDIQGHINLGITRIKLTPKKKKKQTNKQTNQPKKKKIKLTVNYLTYFKKYIYI